MKIIKRILSMVLVFAFIMGSSGFNVSAAKPPKVITILTPEFEQMEIEAGSTINFSIEAQYGLVKDTDVIDWYTNLDSVDGFLEETGVDYGNKTVVWNFSYEAPTELETDPVEVSFTIFVSDGTPDEASYLVSLIVVEPEPQNAPPVITSISVDGTDFYDGNISVSEGGSIAFDVNVTDVDSSSYTLTTSAPSYGIIKPVENSDSLEYALSSDWSYLDDDYTDTFNIIATDSEGGTSESYLVTVNINANPVAVADQITTNSYESLDIDVLSNDFDPDGNENIAIVSVEQGSGGIAKTSADSTYIIFTPNQGVDTGCFEYTITGGVTATVTINFDNNPVIQYLTVDGTDIYDGNISVAEDSSTMMTVNVDSLDPSSLIVNPTVPTYGTAVFDENSNLLTYVLDPEWSYADDAKTDTFSIIATDQYGSSESYVVTVNINAKAIAVDDNITMYSDETKDIYLLTNDLDPEGDPISIVSVEQVTGGTTAISMDNQYITFTPASDLEYAEGTASVSIMYTITDGSAAYVYITVQIPPVEDDTINYVILGDSIATGTVTGNEMTDDWGVPSVIDSYADYFADYLRGLGDETVNVLDYSKDGDQAYQLLEKLTSPDYKYIQDAIAEADVITISIGGNNLMRAAMDNSLTGYDFDNVDLDDAELGRQEFARDWPQIVELLDVLTDGEDNESVDADIIVNTVYNPYWTDDDLYDAVDSLLNGTQGINTVIKDNAAMYDVADVYSSFSAYNGSIDEMNEVTYMYTDKTMRVFWFIVVELRNPHPTAYGQSLIYDAVVYQYEN